MTTDTLELPELPEPDGSAEVDCGPHESGGRITKEVAAWSEPLVRAYATAAVLAERERCAATCDAVAAKWATFHRVAPAAASECASAIRNKE